MSEIAAEAEGASCDTIFLSSEEFLNSKWDQNVSANVISALNRRFGVENVRLIALVRNQVDLVESTYAQFLRAGMFRVNANEFFRAGRTGIIGFMDWFREKNGFEFFSYSDLLRRFREHAPNNPFDVLSIEREDLKGRDVMEVLCDMLDLPLPAEARPTNQRFSDQALLMLRYAMARHGVPIEPFRRNLIRRLFADAPSGFSPILYLTGDALQRVINSAKRDDLFLKENFHGDFGSLLQKSIDARSGRGREGNLTVRPEDRALVDYVICAKEPSLKDAERVKAELGL